jgi:hypothetical protein
VYEAAGIPEISATQLIYFATSIFWRGAVTDWELPTGKYERLDISPDLVESFRKYLRGEQPFPPDVAVLLHVSAAPKPLDTQFPPYPVDSSGKLFHFYIPGLLFTLGIAQPHLLDASLGHPAGRLALSSQGDKFMRKVGINHVRKAIPTPKLAKKLR